MKYFNYMFQVGMSHTKLEVKNLILLMILTTIMFSQPVFEENNTNDDSNQEPNLWIEKVEIDQYSFSDLDSIFIDPIKFKLLMENLEDTLYKEPVNAKFGDHNEIIEGKTGRALDNNKFISKFYRYYYDNQEGKMKVPIRKIYPKVDSGLLREISVRKLGTYTTYFRKTNEERSHNIWLASEAIDSTVIFPGETFSFNEVVGERTIEKGYKRAPVIVKGELSEDIGGGICQVSSTLFNAVDLKGIQIVERYAHSKRVPYVPPGRDATVSWWGPDFTFKNLYNDPILIRSKVAYGTISVSIYSTESAENFTGQ